jgi:hypothetical protein
LWSILLGKNGAPVGNGTDRYTNQLIFRAYTEQDSYATYNNVLSLIGNGSVGINTDNPLQRLDIQGLSWGREEEAYFGVNDTGWLSLLTFNNNAHFRVKFSVGADNSEEHGEIEVMTTYYRADAFIQIKRGGYRSGGNPRFDEVRVTGTDGGNLTLYMKVSTTDYGPTVKWRILEYTSRATPSITINNSASTPGSGTGFTIPSDKRVIKSNAKIYSTDEITAFN